MELMVAMIMAAIVVAPLYVVTRSLTSQAKLEQIETEAMQRARIGLHTLLTDLSMTGLHASPNPFHDPRSFLFNKTAGNALYRHAVIHLNPNDNDATDGEDDAILLVGNFFGGRSYPALYQGGNVFSTYDTAAITADECNVSGFLVRGEYHSYAHIEKPDGRTVDAEVSDAVFASGICTVTVENGEIPQNSVTPGDTVFISSNQAALYQVETTTFVDGFERRDLVRTFVNFDGDAGGDCTVSATGTIQPVAFTRQVIAEYVASFQVWFRAVTANPASTVVPDIPNFYALDVDEPLVPSEDDNDVHVLVATKGNAPDDDDLSCEANSPIEAQHIRSAVVLLSVHSEKPDQALDETAFGTTPTRFVDLSIQNCTTGPCAGAASAYKLKTVVTEVDMPNLAARSDIP
jgi:hypothetical protein